jgi:hypothetical protein
MKYYFTYYDIRTDGKVFLIRGTDTSGCTSYCVFDPATIIYMKNYELYL